MEGFTLRILGTCTSYPAGAGQDCSCMLLDHSVMVDTGMAGVHRLLDCGEDPNAIDFLFITHCHHDHYLALPQLLFYHRTRGRLRQPGRRPLTIVGPKPEIRLVVERALHFLRTDAYEDVADEPTVVPLYAGESFETPRFTVTTCPTIHTVTGLCYRFTDKTSGASAVLTGDTAFHDGLVRHAQGADLLVHEASYGPRHRDANLVGGHSGAPDAARVAHEAQVRRLALIHYAPAQRDATLQAARETFPDTIAPHPGEELAVTRG